jgi:sugar lactone lactonase YvrE
MRLASPALVAALALPAAAGEITVITDRALFPEGPAFVGGDLYWAEYGGHTVARWDGTAAAPIWTRTGCGPSAVLPFQGGLLVTCYDSGEVVHVGLDGTTLAVIAGDAQGGAFVGPNDIAPDGAGGAYFTTSGPWESGPIVGRIYHLGADGKAHLVADDLHYANGLALEPGGARLFVNESEAGRVITFAIGPDHTLSDRRLFARIGVADPVSGIGAYPDGLKFAPDGSLWVGQYSSGRIVVLDREGKLVRVLEVPSPAAPNLAFAPDGAAVYVMAVDQTGEAPYRGTVYRVTLP